MVLLIFLIILLHYRRTFLPLANNSDFGLGTRIRPRSHSPENEARDGIAGFNILHCLSAYAWDCQVRSSLILSYHYPA